VRSLNCSRSSRSLEGDRGSGDGQGGGTAARALLLPPPVSDASHEAMAEVGRRSRGSSASRLSRPAVVVAITTQRAPDPPPAPDGNRGKSHWRPASTTGEEGTLRRGEDAPRAGPKQLAPRLRSRDRPLLCVAVRLLSWPCALSSLQSPPPQPQQKQHDADDAVTARSSRRRVLVAVA